MSLPAVEIGVYGATCGLFLLAGALAWRDRRHTRSGQASAALGLSAAAASLTAVPGFDHAGVFWRAPVLILAAGSPVLFWLWARIVFDDDFILRVRHAVLWALLAAATLLEAYGVAPWSRLVPAVHIMLQLTALGLAVLAAMQTMATWRDDLVAGRRRLRVVVLLGAVLYISVNAIYGSGLGPLAITPAAIDTFRAAGLCVLAVLTAWSLQQVDPQGPTAVVLPANEARGPAAPEPKVALQDVDPVLLKRLEHMMTKERIFRQEGLTIGALASRLAVPEEQLRRAIHQGLGYRNFNAFVNHHRIADAKAALSDPSQCDVPVLTIAMDSGFQSLGPFNRAFKADTGLTPTEYRRMARGPADVSPSGAADRKIG